MLNLRPKFREFVKTKKVGGKPKPAAKGEGDEGM